MTSQFKPSLNTINEENKNNNNDPLVYNSNTIKQINKKVLSLEAERDEYVKNIHTYFTQKVDEIHKILAKPNITNFDKKYSETELKFTLDYYSELMDNITKKYNKMIDAVFESFNKKGGKSTKRTRKHKSKRRHSRRK